jgi:SAM-dependent methyltransferase
LNSSSPRQELKHVDCHDHDNLLQYNRRAWNAQVAAANKWTVPVSADKVAAARQGDWQIVLTPNQPVSRDWFPDFSAGDTSVLLLAGGGGQQGPILAAAGARVTILDNSDAQLQQDRQMADRYGLAIETIDGDMAELTPLANESFDLIVHPCSNCFVPEILPVWKEAFRVLKPGGDLLSGFTNPVRFMFDDELMQVGQLVVRHKIPYSDLSSIDERLQQKYRDENEPIAFGHTLTDQIAGQIEAGFRITGFYEDASDEQDDPL